MNPPWGTYRVWHIRNAPARAVHYTVGSPHEGAVLINGLAKTDLTLPWVQDNAFGMEVREDGEWVEWYDPETGESVDEIADRLWEPA